MDQVEFADLILMNKTDLVSPEDLGRLEKFLQQSNPKAEIMQTSYSRIDVSKVFEVSRFNMHAAAENPKWLAEARTGEHTPESVEYGISSFIFRSKRPFNPEKFCELLNHACQKNGPLHSLLRLKGIAWFADNNDSQMLPVFAGVHLELRPGQPWWATVSKSEWPEGLEEEIQPLWTEPYGDRQSELVCIGLDLNKTLAEEALTACLLTDSEFAAGPSAWNFDSKLSNTCNLDAHHHKHDHHMCNASDHVTCR